MAVMIKEGRVEAIVHGAGQHGGTLLFLYSENRDTVNMVGRTYLPPIPQIGGLPVSAMEVQPKDIEDAQNKNDGYKRQAVKVGDTVVIRYDYDYVCDITIVGEAE